MDEDALSTLAGLFDKLKDLIGHDVALVDDDLIVRIQPVVGQVAHADWLPMVGDLSSAAVDHARDLVSDDELKVLRSQLVTDKETILDLDCSENLAA